MNRKIYFTLIILIFTSWRLFGDNILPKKFGNKESTNKCLIYYPLFFESKDTSEIDKIGIFDTRNFADLLETIGISCLPLKNESLFDIKQANIYKFVNTDKLLFPKHSIIFFNTHGSEYGSYISFEHFETIRGREKRYSELINQGISDGSLGKGSAWENVYDAKGNKFTYEYYTIDVNQDFLKKYLKMNNALFVYSSCFSSQIKDLLFSLGASAVLSADSLSWESRAETIITNFFKYLTGNIDKRDGSRINYSIDEINDINIYAEGSTTYKVSAKDPSDMKYVLYRQPKIDEITISQKSDDTTDKNKVIYHYKYKESEILNPQTAYPGSDSLDSARINYANEDEKLSLEIIFSEKVDITKKINALAGDGYLFRLYADKIINSDNTKIDPTTILKSENYINALDVTEGDGILKTSMTFDLAEFKKHGEIVNLSGYRVFFIAKVPDSIRHDEMYYLDTDGNGREDKMGLCKPGERPAYPEDDSTANDGLDTNHWFMISDFPELKIGSSEIDKLHLPLIKDGPPPDAENKQPLASDGFIAYPKEEYGRFAPCYSMLPNNVSSTYCIMDVSQQISSEYMPAFYLNKELLESAKAVEQKKTIGELPDGNAAIISLKTMNYPSYVANLRTEATGQKDKQDQCVPFNAAGEDVSTLKPFISLKLKNYKFIKGNGSRGENYPGSGGTEIDLSDKYDLYAVKGNPCDIVVSLPLKRVFGENIEAYEGKNVLYLETTNGGIDTGREVYSSQSLEFIKSVKPPVNEGAVHGSRRFYHVSDAVSGFDNNHITEWVANISSDPKVGGYVFNMAHNLLDLGPLPETSPTSKATPAPKDESVGGGEIPESGDTQDNGYYADWKPDRGWIQEHQLSIDYASMGCYYKKIWRSVDFAVMYNPKPVLSPVLICEVWRIFKKPNVSCQSGELPPNNQTISVTCKEEKNDANPKKKETEDSDNKDKDEDNPENTQTTNTSTGNSNKNNSDNKSPSPPVIDNITAVRDNSAYNHAALKIDWSDADSDINIYSARVFLINPLNPGFFRELDISSDMDSGNVTSSGCILRNIPEFKEGFYMVKAYIQDQSGLYSTKVKNLLVNIEGPVIHKPFVKDAENKTVTAELSDEGTPVSDWKIDYDKDYTLVPNGRFSAIFTAYLPEQITQGESIANFNLKTTDLAGNDAKDNLYADLYGPRVGVEYQETDKLLASNQLDLDLNSGGIDPYRTELNIDGFIHQGDYKINLINGEYHITYPAYKLSEGDHSAFARACDYDNNCSTSGTLQFHVAWPPEINNFYHAINKNNQTEFLEAKVWDKGKNLDPAGFELNIDGIVIPPSAYSYDLVSMMFYYYPAVPFTAGSHTATLTARDTTGLFDQETITFTSTGITNLILTNKNYRDIEGNGDGIINEGERIYLDLEITNTGDASTKNVWGQLINRSEYIKGVAEKNKRYGFIQPGTSAYNMEPFEFVVNDKVFEREDIDRVEAEMLLRLTDQDIWSGKTVTTDIPFTVVIERMDPMTALFELSVVKPPAQTMDPAFRLEGGWKTFGTDLRSLDIRITQDSLPPSTAHSLAAFQKDLTVVKNDAGKTFHADATLGVGDNRFVVTATADNGVVRTAEVSIKLTSQVGIELDKIGDTREPNVTVTGEAWTTNSKLESVKIYLNGGFVGDAIIDGSGRFSLPVTLNGGENIIRAVALDDQGKSAEDEITVNMHGPLTISWQRKHWSTTETPILACGSYETEGDDIASIVTYVNYASNTHETVINRDLKTFCTTADLQPGNNILRAVGTTTGGVTAETFSRVEYGGLSIEFDSLPPQATSTFTITGRFTLLNENPYTITIWGDGGEAGWTEYIPVINHAARTFSFDATLNEPPTGCGDGQCCCEGNSNYFEGTITQDMQLEYGYLEVIQTNPVCSNGLTYIDNSLYSTGTGYIEGTFFLNVPGAHVADIMVTVYDADLNYHEFHATDYDEILGTWRVYADVTPSHINTNSHIGIRIQDTFGNWFGCGQHAEIYSTGNRIRLDEHHRKDNKKNVIKNIERRKRQPKRSVDGGRD